MYITHNLQYLKKKKNQADTYIRIKNQKSKMKNFKKLASAASNGTAAARVGIGLSPRSAIVVRRTSARTWHSVPPQRTVANVPPRS